MSIEITNIYIISIANILKIKKCLLPQFRYCTVQYIMSRHDKK